MKKSWAGGLFLCDLVDALRSLYPGSRGRQTAELNIFN